MSVPSFEFREVNIGDAIGLNYIVLSGLESGDEVVTNGAFVIDASAQLNNQSSMMNRNLLANTSEDKSETADFVASTPVKFKNQLNKVTVDMRLVQGSAHMFWMEKNEELKMNLTEFSSTTDLKKQRIIFKELSSTLISTLTSFGIADNAFFVQYCPMADDNKGGFWISEQKLIKNPYMGAKMLKCGSTEYTLGSENGKNNKAKSTPNINQHNH